MGKANFVNCVTNVRVSYACIVLKVRTVQLQHCCNCCKIQQLKVVEALRVENKLSWNPILWLNHSRSYRYGAVANRSLNVT